MKPRYIALIVALLVAGCSSRPALILPYFKPYKMDIQQGNVVTQDMIDKVKPGMTRSQVRFALGTPLIADPFHPDRWDYVYHFQKAGVVTEQRRIIVVFKNELLARIEGDVVQAGAPGTSPAGDAKAKPAPTPEKLQPAASKPASSAAASSPPTAGGVTTTVDSVPAAATSARPAGARP